MASFLNFLFTLHSSKRAVSWESPERRHPPIPEYLHWCPPSKWNSLQPSHQDCVEIKGTHTCASLSLISILTEPKGEDCEKLATGSNYVEQSGTKMYMTQYPCFVDFLHFQSSSFWWPKELRKHKSLNPNQGWEPSLGRMIKVLIYL